MGNTLVVRKEQLPDNIQKDLKLTMAQEITRLHNELTDLLMNSLDKAIKIGSLLEEQKKSLPHGEFTSWINQNLPFKERTARNYRKVYRNRDELKRQAVADLNTAYLVLEERRRLERRREQKERIEAEGKRYEYAKEHPEEVEIGEVRYKKSEAGYTLKITTTGELNGLPLTKPECFDPEYIKLEENKAPYDLRLSMKEAIGGIERAIRAIKGIHRKYPGKIKSAYDHDWTYGKTDLYPELKKVWEQFNRIMEKLEN